MKFEIKMVVTADIEIPDDFKKCYGGKPPSEWTVEEINSFKNEIASDFSIIDLGALNEKKTLVSNRRVTEFE